VRFVSVYTRRLAVLFGIGILHSFVYGSVLVPYAWLGFVLMFFRKASPRALLVWVVVLLMFWPVDQHVTRVWNRSHPPDPELATETRQRNAAESQVETDGGQARLRARADGTLLEFLAANRRTVLSRLTEILDWDEYRGSESNIGIFAMFLLGLYVGRRRIFQQTDQHRSLAHPGHGGDVRGAHRGDEVGLAPGRVGDHGRAGLPERVVGDARRLAGAGLDVDLQPRRDEGRDRLGRGRDATLAGRAFAGDEEHRHQ
jgi:uncharacterized protein